MAPTDTVEVVFVNHWTDRRDPEEVKDVLPGAKLTVESDLARRLVRGHVAQYATKKDAAAANDPEGPTPRTT